jgi:CRP-like cAMP-binding protein
VRQVGWITRDTPAEQRSWHGSELPTPRFYIEQNPGYSQGHGLLTLVPLDAGSLAKSILKWGSAQAKRRLQRLRGSLERALWPTTLDEQTTEELLLRAEAAVGLDLDAVRRHGICGTRYPIAARSVLFHKGDAADDLYIVVAGSVFVLGDDVEGQEYVIDQLGPGAMVGETGLATGAPRNATVRAAVDSLLLRITRADLDQLFAAEPRLREEFWRRTSGRILDSCFRNAAPFSQRIPASTAAARRAWIAAGQVHALRVGEQLSCPADSVLVLARGELLVESRPGWISLSGITVASLPQGTVLTGVSPAQLMLLPAEPPSLADDQAAAVPRR